MTKKEIYYDSRDNQTKIHAVVWTPDTEPKAIIILVHGMAEHIERYDEIILGFPIWWYVAPTIINTFLESYDFSGKKIVLFATSGGSGFGNTVSELKPSAPDAVIVEGKVFNKTTKEEIAEWVKRIS